MPNLTEIFQRFCVEPETESIYYLTAPFRIEDYAYATDGHIAIRAKAELLPSVDARQPVPVNIPRLFTDKRGNRHTVNVADLRTDELDEWLKKRLELDSECEECDGFGCEECEDQEFAAFEVSSPSVYIYRYPYTYFYIDLIRQAAVDLGHETIEWFDPVDSRSRLLVSFGDVEIVLMPLSGGHTDTVTLLGETK